MHFPPAHYQDRRTGLTDTSQGSENKTTVMQRNGLLKVEKTMKHQAAVVPSTQLLRLSSQPQIYPIHLHLPCFS